MPLRNAGRYTGEPRESRPKKPQSSFPVSLADSKGNMPSLSDTTIPIERSAPRAVENHLERLRDELLRLKTQLRQTQRLASLGTAAAMFAHEFNNVMTPVVGYARFALDRDDPQLMVKALEITLKQTEAAMGMGDRILGMAISEPAVFKSVSIKQVIESAIEYLCRELSAEGITLTIDVNDALQIWADPKQLQSVFFNLLLNARDALGGRGGRISFKAFSTNQDTTIIKVSDNGCGITSEHLESIFDPFFTTKTSDGDPRGRGSGLGLSICHEIVEEHRGTIAVQSEPNRGTTFTITLPTAV